MLVYNMSMKSKFRAKFHFSYNFFHFSYGCIDSTWPHEHVNENIQLNSTIYIHPYKLILGMGLCRYTWQIYADRLMTLSGVYGFWKYASKLERRETSHYLEMFYSVKHRNLVSGVDILDLPICQYYGHSYLLWFLDRGHTNYDPLP